MTTTPRTGWLRSLPPTMYFHDALCLAGLQCLTILAIVFAWRDTPWVAITGANIAVSALILLISKYDRHTHLGLIDAVHRYYVMLLIFMMYKEIYILQPMIHAGIYDASLIAIDHALFGVNPTEWLLKFSAPLLVEVLQICYFLFYAIMVGNLFEFSLRRQDGAFEKASSALVYGFLLSFVGYLLVPAIGPRFMVHDFASIGRELPGLWLTESIRSLIDAGESITAQTIDLFAAAQRDAFPSGHTEMTLISIFFAWKFKARIRWYSTIVGMGLIFSTVFLRYHYVADVLGGVVFFLITVFTIPFLERWWIRLQLAVSPPPR